MFKKLELLLPPFPLTIVLCGVIFLCAKLTPNFTLNIPSGMEWGVAFWVLGFGFILPAVLSFVKAKTTVDPRKPDKSNKLVISGLYKLSRNPMYVGFLFLVVGTAFFYAHIGGFIIATAFIPYMNRFQISLEEQQLTTTFGEEYTQYCQAVRRWL